MFKNLVQIVFQRWTRFFRLEQQRAHSLDEQIEQFAAFEQEKRTNLFEFVAKLKAFDEEISQRQGEFDARPFDDAFEFEEVQLVGRRQTIELVTNLLRLLLVVERKNFLVVVLQQKPRLADEEDFLGQRQRDVRREHFADQFVLIVTRRVRRRAQRLDVDVFVQPDEKFSKIIVEFAARQQRSDLFEKDSVRRGEKTFHRRGKIRVAVERRPTNGVEELTTAKPVRLERREKIDELRENQRVIAQRNEQMRQTQRLIDETLTFQFAQRLKVRVKDRAKFNGETQNVQTA